MKNGIASEPESCKKKGWRIIRALWLISGFICIGLGTIGIVLPILPTTPFLLAAAACFCKSSTRMYGWLLNNKWFGEYIRNYREGRGLTIKTKITVLAVLWITLGISIIFLLERLLPFQIVLPMQIIMICVGVGVSFHVVKLPSFKKKL